MLKDVRWRGGGGAAGGGLAAALARRLWLAGGGYRGWGAAPFVGGLAAGAIVGGALAYPRYLRRSLSGTYVDNYDYDTYADNYAGDGNAGAYCAQRFKSYDPRSEPILGYDGRCGIPARNGQAS